MRYQELQERISAAMAARGIPTGKALEALMLARGAGVHENTIYKWLGGTGRPQGANLESLLDVLGIEGPEDREAWRRLAYVPPVDRETVSP